MHLRTIVLFSIGLNFVLGIGWGIHYFQNRVYSRNPILRNAAAGAERPVSSANNTTPEKPKRFHWRQVESNDYETYIQNLRAIGCPEETIRDIIVADVNKRFEARRANEARTNEVRWWESKTEAEQAKSRETELAIQESERRQLLSDLLGPDWIPEDESTDITERSGVYLGGPVLGALPAATKETVHQIAATARDRMQSYIDSQRFLGRSPNPTEQAQIRSEMRADLARVLTPVQLEEFLLRYSETAEQLRRDLQGVEVTADEFRLLFRYRDPIENELAMLGGQSNPATRARAEALQNQFNTVLQQTLGPERYAQFQVNQNPGLKHAQERAEKLGLNAEATAMIVALSQEFSQEQQRIQGDASLSANQRIDALAALEAEQQKTFLQLLGADGFQQWQRLQASR